MLINGLPLPRDLLDLIAAGRWRQPADMSGIDAMFVDHAGFHPYGFGTMRSESEAMLRWRDAEWLGAPDPDFPPGDIDVTRAVLIADIGLGFDQPVALDYRPSIDRPRVLTLLWRPRDYVTPTGELRYEPDNRWVTLAPDFKTFAERARL